jgi:hypothetical protein
MLMVSSGVSAVAARASESPTALPPSVADAETLGARNLYDHEWLRNFDARMRAIGQRLSTLHAGTSRLDAADVDEVLAPAREWLVDPRTLARQ